MESKTTKFLLKTILLFPVGFLFFSFMNGFNNFNLVISAILGLMLSLGIIFWNLFDYEKHDEIAYEDFLESSHKTTLENTDENWNVISEVLKNQFLNLVTLELNAKIIKKKIERRYMDSILTAKREPNEIVVKIERKYFKFLPDNAGNYGMLRKISKQISLNTESLATNIE